MAQREDRGGVDPGVEMMLEEARNTASATPPTVNHDEAHDIWTVFFRNGRHTGVIVDEYLTIFEDDEGRLIGVQLSNLKQIADCLGPAEVHWEEGTKISLIRLVLRTFNLHPDGVEQERREKMYFRTAAQLAEVPEICLPAAQQ